MNIRLQEFLPDFLRWITNSSLLMFWMDFLKKVPAKILILLLEQARARLYSRGTIHEAYRSLIPMACFHHYLSTGITNTLEGKKGCYDRFDEDSWRHAVLTNLQQAVRELRKLQQVNQGLYECLNQSNHTLNRIEQGNQRIYGQLDAVRTNTELTAYNSRVSALANSAMTYMYYDRNYR